MEYAELHVRTYKKLKRWVSFIISHAIVVKFVHLYGQKPICPNRADYGRAIQYDIGSFLKNKFLSFEEWVFRSRCNSNYRHITYAHTNWPNLSLFLLSENVQTHWCDTTMISLACRAVLDFVVVVKPHFAEFFTTWTFQGHMTWRPCWIQVSFSKCLPTKKWSVSCPI